MPDPNRPRPPQPEPPEISVVVPLYNEEENVAELHRRLTAALGGVGATYEILYVDDGSRDATPGMIDALGAGDPHVSVLHLSRNFGHQASVSAGIDHALGRAVVVMDGDLQDPPEVIPGLVRRWRDGFDVVYAVRHGRKEGLGRRLGYHAFYRLLNAVSDLEIPLDSGDFSLMDRRVVEALRKLPEKLRFVRGLRTFVGFRQTGLPYERGAREAGESKYPIRSLLRLATDGLVSFSSYPLRLSTYLGLAGIAVAVGLTVWVFYDAFTARTGPRGWPSLIVVVLFLGSAQLLCLGVIGEYVRLIFLESKQRPTYIVGAYSPRRGAGGGDAAGKDDAQ
jgi:glycosyltransferase involved in cell wall biosynthesis